VPFYNQNGHYAGLAVRQCLRHAATALDVGCGDGRYTVLLREAGIPHVAGLDVEASVLPTERESGIEWLCGDFLTHEFAQRRFDFIIAIASIHHMPLADALTQMRAILTPDGSLAVLGLYRSTTLTDRALDIPAFAANQYFGWTRSTTQTPAPIRPPNMSLREVTTVARDVLPGANVRRLLLWRYLLTWPSRSPSRERRSSRRG
jgi:SAM-dependent methyltransferase